MKKFNGGKMASIIPKKKIRHEKWWEYREMSHER